MESILHLNKILTEYKRVFGSSPDSDVTFDHMVVLYCLSKKIDRTSLISRKTSKDKAYISRLLKSMIKRGLVQKLGSSYDMTHMGSDLYNYMQKIHMDFLEDNSLDLFPVSSLNIHRN